MDEGKVVVGAEAEEEDKGGDEAIRNGFIITTMTMIMIAAMIHVPMAHP